MFLEDFKILKENSTQISELLGTFKNAFYQLPSRASISEEDYKTLRFLQHCWCYFVTKVKNTRGLQIDFSLEKVLSWEKEDFGFGDVLEFVKTSENDFVLEMLQLFFAGGSYIRRQNGTTLFEYQISAFNPIYKWAFNSQAGYSLKFRNPICSITNALLSSRRGLARSKSNRKAPFSLLREGPIKTTQRTKRSRRSSRVTEPLKSRRKPKTPKTEREESSSVEVIISGHWDSPIRPSGRDSKISTRGSMRSSVRDDEAINPGFLVDPYLTPSRSDSPTSSDQMRMPFSGWIEEGTSGVVEVVPTKDFEDLESQLKDTELKKAALSKELLEIKKNVEKQILAVRTEITQEKDDALEAMDSEYQKSISKLKGELERLNKEKEILVSDQEALKVDRSRIEELTSQVDELKTQLMRKNEEYESDKKLLIERAEVRLQNEISEICDVYKLKIFQKDERIVDLEDQLMSLSSDLSKLQLKFGTLEESHKSLEKEIFYREGTIGDLSERLEGLKESSKNLLVDNGILTQKIEVLETKLNSVSQLEESDIDIEVLRGEIEALTEKVTELEKIETLQLETQSLLDVKIQEVASFETLLSEKTAALDMTHSEVDSLKETIRELERSGTQETTEKVIEFEKTIDALRKELAAKEKECELLVHDQVEIDDLYQQALAEIEDLKNHISILKKENEGLRSEVDRLTAENTTLHTRIGELESEVHTVSVRNEELEEQVRQLEAKNEAQDEVIRYLDRQLKEKDEEIGEKEELIQELSEKIRTLNENLDAVKDGAESADETRESLKEEIDKIEKEIEGFVKINIRSQEERGEIEGKLKTTQANFDRQRRTIVELQRRLDKQERIANESLERYREFKSSLQERKKTVDERVEKFRDLLNSFDQVSRELSGQLAGLDEDLDSLKNLEDNLKQQIDDLFADRKLVSLFEREDVSVSRRLDGIDDEMELSPPPASGLSRFATSRATMFGGFRRNVGGFIGSSDPLDLAGMKQPDRATLALPDDSEGSVTDSDSYEVSSDGETVLVTTIYQNREKLASILSELETVFSQIETAVKDYNSEVVSVHSAVDKLLERKDLSEGLRELFGPLQSKATIKGVFIESIKKGLDICSDNKAKLDERIDVFPQRAKEQYAETVDAIKRSALEVILKKQREIFEGRIKECEKDLDNAYRFLAQEKEFRRLGFSDTSVCGELDRFFRNFDSKFDINVSEYGEFETFFSESLQKAFDLYQAVNVSLSVDIDVQDKGERFELEDLLASDEYRLSERKFREEDGQMLRFNRIKKAAYSEYENLPYFDPEISIPEKIKVLFDTCLNRVSNQVKKAVETKISAVILKEIRQALFFEPQAVAKVTIDGSVDLEPSKKRRKKKESSPEYMDLSDFMDHRLGLSLSVFLRLLAEFSEIFNRTKKLQEKIDLAVCIKIYADEVSRFLKQLGALQLFLDGSSIKIIKTIFPVVQKNISQTLGNHNRLLQKLLSNLSEKKRGALLDLVGEDNIKFLRLESTPGIVLDLSARKKQSPVNRMSDEALSAPKVLLNPDATTAEWKGYITATDDMADILKEHSLSKETILSILFDAISEEEVGTKKDSLEYLFSAFVFRVDYYKKLTSDRQFDDILVNERLEIVQKLLKKLKILQKKGRKPPRGDLSFGISGEPPKSSLRIIRAKKLSGALGRFFETDIPKHRSEVSEAGKKHAKDVEDLEASILTCRRTLKLSKD